LIHSSIITSSSVDSWQHVLQVIAWVNKACDHAYPDTCLQWAGFLAKLAIHYDRVSAGHADVGIMNRVSLLSTSSSTSRATANASRQ